jgi:hypothetical protein
MSGEELPVVVVAVIGPSAFLLYSFIPLFLPPFTFCNPAILQLRGAAND